MRMNESYMNKETEEIVSELKRISAMYSSHVVPIGPILVTYLVGKLIKPGDIYEDESRKILVNEAVSLVNEIFKREDKFI